MRPLAVLVLLLVVGEGLFAQDSSPAVMTTELMARLHARTLASDKTNAVLNERLSGLFGINDGSKAFPALQIATTTSDGNKHAFNVPLKAGYNDIVIMLRRPDSVDAYLTDRTAVLRAAAVIDGSGIRKIPIEQAMPKYQLELALFAAEAAKLPAAKQ